MTPAPVRAPLLKGGNHRLLRLQNFGGGADRVPQAQPPVRRKLPSRELADERVPGRGIRPGGMR